MRRYLQLLLQYFLQYAKVRLAYKGDFFVSIVTTLIATAFGVAVVFLLFHRLPEIAGWKFHEILFLYGFGLIPLSFFNVVSINLYYFSEAYIVEGKFDRILLRPVHSLFQVMSEQFRLESLSDAVVGVGIVTYTARELGITYGPLDWAFLVFAAVCGVAIYLSVFLLLTSVSFWVEDRVGIIPPIFNMLAFGRYPLNIYSPFIQFLLSWIIPFGFASFYPSTILLGRVEYQSYFLYLPVVTIVFMTASILLWNRGVANYSSTGS